MSLLCFQCPAYVSMLFLRSNLNKYAIMTLMFTVVSWLPASFVLQVTGPRGTTVNSAFTVPVRLDNPFTNKQ